MTITNSTMHRRRAVLGAVTAVAAVAGGVLVLQNDADADPTTSPSPQGELRQFGRITGAYVGPRELAFEPAELFVGDAARRAAAADGVPADDIRDFYVRDDGPAETLAVASDVDVTVVDCSDGPCVEGVPVDFDTFTLDPAGWYRVVVEDGVVVAIDEQYLP